jgi:hypothetical protein
MTSQTLPLPVEFPHVFLKPFRITSPTLPARTESMGLLVMEILWGPSEASPEAPPT